MTEQTTTEKAPKKPQDRKPKAEEGPQTLTATVRGEEFKVASDAMDDFELLDDLARIDDGDATRMPSVLRRMLGGEDYQRAMRLVRDPESGRVSIESGAEFVNELLEALNPSS